MAQTVARAAIYCRISDDREGKSLGVQRQEQDCRSLADRLHWDLHPTAPVYVDNDISASTKSRKVRPQFAALLTAVEAGEVDAVIYYSNSRLTRRPREYEDVIDLVRRTGVRLASVASGNVDLTTADGRAVARTIAAWDAAEAERTGERVKRKMEERREKGLPNPSRRAYGFEKGGMEVVPAEADAIRLGADLVLSGASLGDVIRRYEQEGIEPLTAKAWTRTTVRRALTNPRVAGLVSQGGEIVGEGTFEGIMTRETWEAVRAAMSDRSSLVRARFQNS